MFLASLYSKGFLLYILNFHFRNSNIYKLEQNETEATNFNKTMLSKRQKVSHNEGYAFTMHEKWDVKALNAILSRRSALLRDDGEADHQAFSKLMQISNAVASEGILAVHYFHSSTTASFQLDGRVYGTGYQSVPGWVRRYCGHKYYHDIDIVNCFPVILDQLAQQHHIDARYLHQYVNHRDQILAADVEEVGLSRDVAKLQYLKLMFGSSEMDYETQFLANFKSDIDEVTEHFWRLQAYAPYRTCAQANAAAQPNVKASFLSLVIQAVERRIVDVAIATVRSEFEAYKVDTYVFDGFMVQKQGDTEMLPQSMLETLANVVQEKTGFVITFVEKSLVPTECDLLRVRPAFNNFTVESHWDEARVFNQLDMMAKELNQNPVEGNADRFRKNLVPVMNEAFALVKDTSLLVATRYFDDHDSVDYKFMKWTAAREMYEEKTACIIDGSKPVSIEIVPTWRRSKYALCYNRRVFNPRPYDMDMCAKPQDLNSFVGLRYRCQERYGEETLLRLRETVLKPFWDHVFRIWCQSTPELFTYVHNWLCSRVQRPWYRVDCALILRSEQGAGKGVIMDKLAEVLGKQYMSKPPSLEHITGNSFNKHYFYRSLVMFLDEAFYAGSKATKNQMKTKITEPYVVINEKHVPHYTIERFSSVVLASNEDHVINREVKSRRYLCLGLNNSHAGVHRDGSVQSAYFTTILKVDPQILCNYMCSVDLEGWSGRDVPETVEGEQQAIQSMSMEGKFVLNVLEDPNIIQQARLEYQRVHPDVRHTYEFPKDMDPLGGLYVTTVLFELFQKSVKRILTPKEAFKVIKQSIPGVKNDPTQFRIRGERARCLFFPELDEAREAYKAKVGLKLHQFSS